MNLLSDSKLITFDNYFEPEYRIDSNTRIKEVIVGKTEIMLDIFYYINYLASFPTTVLLRGESGTGKELFAKALHYNGKNNRKEKKFVAVNCAGIPSELLESELFGYVKGAFTGAFTDTLGKFQYANGGTILLDEIGDMNFNLQAKILRVLDEKKITRVGSNTSEDVDVRVIAATHMNLEEMVKNGNFREDLYYRLNVVPVKIPSIKQRKDDIPLIAKYLIEKYNIIYGSKIEGLSKDAEEKLLSDEWKGNIREIDNVVQRVFILRKKGMIEADDLHFNSDMPSRIYFQKKEVDKSLIMIKEHENVQEEKSWYQKGVLPILPLTISRMEGAKSLTSIKRIVEDRMVYGVKISGEFQRSELVCCLNPNNYHLFFKDTDTKHYEDLMQKILEDDFNKIVEQPFAFFNIQKLVKNQHASSSSDYIHRAIRNSGVYILSDATSPPRFVITADKADYFVTGGNNKEWRVEQLKAEIMKTYESFKNWKPKLY